MKKDIHSTHNTYNTYLIPIYLGWAGLDVPSQSLINRTNTLGRNRDMKNSNLFQRIGWLSAMALTVAAVAASCSQDELVNGTGKDNPVIGFGISAARTENDSLRTRAANSEEESPVILLGQKGADTLYLHTLVEDNTTLPSPEQLQTRGVPVNEENFKEKCETFLVNAFTPEGNPYMKNVEVASSGKTSIWSPTDGIHYWPDMSLDFYAYAPLSVFDGDNAPGSSLSYGNDENGKSISFSYTVPTSSDGTTDAEAQPDIMFAHTTCSQGGTNESGVVPLEFAHALAGVKFVTKDITKATVKTITLKNLYGEGTCVYNSGDGTEGRAGTFTWTYSGEKDKSYSQTFNVQVKDEQTEEQPITDKKPEATFMLIPQALDGVKIEVLLGTEDGVKMVDGVLTGEWEAGKIYTYAISTESINWTYVFEVTPTVTISLGDTLGSYEVKSYRYRTYDKNVVQSVAWKAENTGFGETDKATDQPVAGVALGDILDSFTSEGNGSTAEKGESCLVDVTRTTMHTDYPGDETLKGETPKGTPENPYDLSTSNGTLAQETANCYVINAPGTYKLPLVYGNGLKNGENSSAYSGFKNHLNDQITSPYIYANTGCVPYDCCLVWSDGFFMFRNVHLSEDGKWLVFTVDADYMQQANAVVAVRDAKGDIMWSWHIWVTERSLSETHEVDDYFEPSIKYHLMQCNLGWVDGKMVYYNERNLKFQFVQEGSGEIREMEVVQSGVAFDYKDVGSTYYQWGRKDPLVALRNWDAVGRDDYRLHETGSPEYVYTVDQNDKASVNMAIQHPNVFYTSMNFPDAVLWNNQDGGGTDNSKDSQKTIYDPSPRGFKVPVPRAFAVLVNGGTEGSGSSDPVKDGLNGYKLNEEPYNKYRVYTKKNGEGELIPFTATGQRAERDGSLPTYDENGSQKAELGGLWAMYGVYYWSCVQKSAVSANTLVIREDVPSGYAVYSYLFSGTKTMARPVRCIKDE